MSKFLYTLSIIFVVAKIFGLVTFSWGLCLLPALCVIIGKIFFCGWFLERLTKALKELEEMEDE